MFALLAWEPSVMKAYKKKLKPSRQYGTTTYALDIHVIRACLIAMIFYVWIFFH